jgi:Ca-activated chloride channel family protein
MKTNRRFEMWLAGMFAAILFAASVAPAKTPAQATLDISVSHPYLLAGKTQTAYLRVALTGFDLIAASTDRSPVNVAVVLDKSGSMTGDKIEKVKEAAITAIERLNSNDIVSIVTYDSTVTVVVPATKVSDKSSIIRKIRSIEAGGSTALFGGVSKGAQEVRKFIDRERVNRIILLSDGLANVGPSSPSDLGSLGASLAKEEISVTTIGVGLDYNEDLMTKLAYKSDGNHYFAERASELARIFDKEFGQVLSVVAQEIQLEIKFARGVRPLRLLGRTGFISGRTAIVSLSNLYSDHEKFALFEVEIEPEAADSTRTLATVNASYRNMKSHATDRLEGSIDVNFCKSPSTVEKRTNKKIMVDVVKLVAAENNDLVIALRDKGKVKEAQEAGGRNFDYLMSNAVILDSSDLRQDSMIQKGFNEKLGDELEYNESRKGIRAQQHQYRTNQKTD